MAVKNYAYTLPIGPQHPALKEAFHLKFDVTGERVRDVNISLGYMHRGIEKAMAERNYSKGIHLAERVCGICSNCHSTAYASTLEKIAGVEIPDRAKYIRTIFNENERIASHLLWAGVAAHEIGFDTLFMYLWRDREHVLNLFDAIAGNRVNKGINIPGGVRFDISGEQLKAIQETMDILKTRLAYYTKAFTKDSTIKKRAAGVGVLTKEDAEKFGATGPHARASGLEYDIRDEDPYLLYNHLDWKIRTHPAGDVFSRVVVRLQEIGDSVSMVEQCLDPPKTQLSVPMPSTLTGEAAFRIEAQRGELFYYVNCNGEDTPLRVRIRTPTYANWATLKSMFRDAYVADIPIIVASLDPCLSCTDRMIICENGKEKVLTKEEVKNWK